MAVISSHAPFIVVPRVATTKTSGISVQAGVSCSNYKYGNGISNLLKYFLIYLANQINRINMTRMDNYKFKLFKILRCCATVTVDIRYTNSINCAVFVIYQFKNVNEVWERSSH